MAVSTLCDTFPVEWECVRAAHPETPCLFITTGDACTADAAEITGSTKFCGGFRRRFVGMRVRSGRSILPPRKSLFLSAAPAAGHTTESRFRDIFHIPKDPEPVLTDILARDEFRQSLGESFFDQLQHSLTTALQRLLEWLLERRPRLNIGQPDWSWELIWTVVSSLFVGLAIGLVLLGLIFLVRRFVLPALRKTPLVETAGASADPRDDRSPGSLRRKALALAQEGRFPDAVVLLFRAVLFDLDKEGRLAFHPAKTNGELLLGLSAESRVREILREMTVIFDAIRYGGRLCGEPEFARFLKLADRATSKE